MPFKANLAKGRVSWLLFGRVVLLSLQEEALLRSYPYLQNGVLQVRSDQVLD